jgi:hypothetical protein
MAQSGAGDLDAPITPALLRHRAVRARRLSRGLSMEADRQKLAKFADELEAMAAELERDGVGE